MGHSIKDQQKAGQETFADDPVGSEISSALLVDLARKIASRGLSVPAIFLLELYKPFTGIFHQLGLMAHPLLSVFMGKGSSELLLRAVSSEEAIERLICSIESCQRDR